MSQLRLSGGIELHYTDRGSGVPIVFSHGLLWSGRMYDAQVEALSSRYRCITYDHRGQGQSATSPVPYDMELLAADAAALIVELAAVPCHFVGLSMGGFVGLRLALQRPELLRSLTLIESAADGEPLRNVPKYRAMAFIARYLGFGPLIGPTMRIMFGAAFRSDPARAAERAAARAELSALDADRMEAALTSVIRRRPLLGELGRITTPTLVLHGADDRAIKVSRGKRTAAAIPGARLVVLPRAGHTATVEEPDAITGALSSFLDGLGGAQ